MWVVMIMMMMMCACAEPEGIKGSHGVALLLHEDRFLHDQEASSFFFGCFNQLVPKEHHINASKISPALIGHLFCPNPLMMNAHLLGPQGSHGRALIPYEERFPSIIEKFHCESTFAIILGGAACPPLPSLIDR